MCLRHCSIAVKSHSDQSNSCKKDLIRDLLTVSSVHSIIMAGSMVAHMALDVAEGYILL